MAEQEITANVWLINPFATTQPFFFKPSYMRAADETAYTIDEDNWVDYHADPAVNDVEIVSP
jgi:hypothetical protein